MSAEAQAFLNFDIPEGPSLPSIADTHGWKLWASEQNKVIEQAFAGLQPPDGTVERQVIDAGGVATYSLRPMSVDPVNAPLHLDFHGGGFILCGGDTSWQMVAQKASARPGVTWVPDYRTPPEYPYPLPLDDCLGTYRHALKTRSPEQIVVCGASAGGNLAAAMLLRAKDEGLPMPAALVLQTPELDLTESGDTFQTNNGIDIMGPLMRQNLLYAQGHELSDPYLSPLFGNLRGLPPTLLQSGTRDLFLSNTVRMHRRLLDSGVPVELHVFEAMPHGSFGGYSPEARELMTTVLDFEMRHLKIKSPGIEEPGVSQG
ncbi:alpha/beta hydrolase [Williamsia muralis]|uniref:alpha/beta hydrolase n=1 Tax=Williamsia marianensis TaxID=85044 RepID=UPI0037F11860